MLSSSHHPVTPTQVEAALKALGLTCLGQVPSTSVSLVEPAVNACPSLTKVQGEMVTALTKKPPLNVRQVAILEIYVQAAKAGEPALAVDAMAARLVGKVAVDPARAADYVKGALRSFGKRLFAELSKVPVQFGKDAMGDGVADEIPLLAMFDITKGNMGEARHKLTPDGVVAVTAALALNSKGEAASSTAAGNPDEIVTLAMTRGTAAQVMRVASTKGLGIDSALRLMTALAGAG